MFLRVRDKRNSANGVRRRSLSTASQKHVLWSSCRACGGWKFNATSKLKRLLLFTRDVRVWLLNNELVLTKKKFARLDTGHRKYSLEYFLFPSW